MLEKAPENKKTGWAWPVPISYVAFIHFYLFALYCHGVAARIRAVTKGNLYADFVNNWTAARAALEGRILDTFSSERNLLFQKTLFGPEFNTSTEWIYPPHFLPWLLWIGTMPYSTAYAAYVAVTFAFYALAVLYKQPHPLVMGLVLLLAPASFVNINFGQNGFLMAAFLIGGMRLLQERPKTAGVLFGFLTFKIQLCVLVPLALLAGRHWRTLAAMAITTAVLIAFSIALFGLEPWLGYIRFILPLQHQILVAPGAHPTFHLGLAITPFFAARHLGASLGVAAGVAAVCSLYAAAAVVYVFARPASTAVRTAVLTTATFLATPYALVYELPAMSAVVVLLLAAHGARELSWDKAALFLALWLLPFSESVGGGELTTYIAVSILFVFLGAQLLWIAREDRAAAVVSTERSR